MFQIQSVPNLIASLQKRIDILFGMRRANTESDTAGHEGCSWVPNDNDNDGCPTGEHHATEDGHFTRVEEEQWGNGRVDVSIGDETEFDERAGEIARVESEATESFPSFAAVAEGRREGYPRWD